MASIFDSPLQKSLGSVFDNGFLISDAITVKFANSKDVYTAWNSVSIQTSMQTLSRSFSLSVNDKWRLTKEGWPFFPQEETLIAIGGEPVITGYIDSIASTVSNDDRSIAVSGRDRTADLVDSAAIGLKAQYKNQSILQIATTYAQDLNVKVTTDSARANEPIPNVVVNQGETIFELLHRLTVERGLLMLSNNNSELFITTQPLNSKGNELRQGENVLFATSNLDDSNRFQKYLVKSQIKGNDFVNGKDASKISAVSFDDNVERQRTKYIIAEKSMDIEGAKKRAQWEAANALANSRSATATVQGWRDKYGDLWTENQIAYCDLRFVGLPVGEYLISGVEFSQSVGSGTLTTLTISEIDAFVPQPTIPKKDTKNQWKTNFGSELNPKKPLIRAQEGF